MANKIQQLKNKDSETVFPITVTSAIYDEGGHRLDNLLDNMPIITDKIEETETEVLLDADILGGKYTAEDLDNMPKSESVVDYTGVEIPMIDADMLGGRYTKEDVDNLITENNELKAKVETLNNSLSELIKYVDITIGTGDNIPANDSRAYDFTTQLAGKTILSAVLQTTVVGVLAFKIDYSGKRVVFSNVSNTTVKLSDGTVIRFYYLNI